MHVSRPLLLALLLLIACAEEPADVETTDLDTLATDDLAVAGEPTQAFAQLQPTAGNEAEGLVTFTLVGDEVEVVAQLSGLGPGQHGFHVHETGDCSAPDASSAGGHFSPDGSPHGAPDDPPDARHVGDLGNVTADAQGMVETTFTDSLLAFAGPRSILGKAVIVHAEADDLESQPSGAAGERLACGVIEPLNDPAVQEITPEEEQGVPPGEEDGS